jgi:hypothetical protein
MALIAKFEPIVGGASGRVHGAVECGRAMFETGGHQYLQLDTYGSKARVMPGRVSQSIQLDEDGARELMRLLTRAFPSLSQ